VEDLENELSKYCKKVYGVKHFKPKSFALTHWFFSNKPYRHVKCYNALFSKTLKYELINNRYDVVFCNFLDMAQYFENIQIPYKPPIFVLDQHNVDELWYEKFVRAESPLLRIFGRENIKRLRKRQGNDYRNFNLCLSVSEEDAEFTKRLLGTSMNVIVSPNGVDLDYFSPHAELKSGNVILFCGSMDSIMNQDAVHYFYSKILPKIKIQIPNVQFIIVGRKPPLKIKNLNNHKGIIVTGTVDDVRPFYEKASVVVAPFRLGGGTKLKITEAMAMRLPIISTSIGCQGINVQNGKDVWIADNDFDFSERVIKTLTRISNKMVDNAYKLVCELYSWDKIVNDAERVIRKMITELGTK
jgi:glycosyltransferase involved in cell wall biosynthesis